MISLIDQRLLTEHNKRLSQIEEKALKELEKTNKGADFDLIESIKSIEPIESIWSTWSIDPIRSRSGYVSSQKSLTQFTNGHDKAREEAKEIISKQKSPNIDKKAVNGVKKPLPPIGAQVYTVFNFKI